MGSSDMGEGLREVRRKWKLVEEGVRRWEEDEESSIMKRKGVLPLLMFLLFLAFSSSLPSSQFMVHTSQFKLHSSDFTFHTSQFHFTLYCTYFTINFTLHSSNFKFHTSCLVIHTSDITL